MCRADELVTIIVLLSRFKGGDSVTCEYYARIAIHLSSITMISITFYPIQQYFQ